MTRNFGIFQELLITSTGFYRHCAPDVSAPVVVIHESPIIGLKKATSRLNSANSRLNWPILAENCPIFSAKVSQYAGARLTRKAKGMNT